MTFSLDGKQLVSGFYDKTIKLWDIASGALQQTIETSEIIHRLSFCQNEPYLETNRGLIKIQQDQADISSSQSRSAREIFLRGDWIGRDAENLVWLPSEYRAAASDWRDGNLALGHVSGWVTFFAFCFNPTDQTGQTAEFSSFDTTVKLEGKERTIVSELLTPANEKNLPLSRRSCAFSYEDEELFNAAEIASLLLENQFFKRMMKYAYETKARFMGTKPVRTELILALQNLSKMLGQDPLHAAHDAIIRNILDHASSVATVVLEQIEDELHKSFPKKLRTEKCSTWRASTSLQEQLNDMRALIINHQAFDSFLAALRRIVYPSCKNMV